MALDVDTFTKLNTKATEQYNSVYKESTDNIETYKSMPKVIGIVPDELKDLSIDTQKGV